MENESSRVSNHIDLEQVRWMSLDEWQAREKTPAAGNYVTFEDMAEAIDDLGTLEVCNDRVNIFFMRTSGRFEEDIVVVRQSGLNVRRILVKKSEFEQAYGNYEECLNHMMSNNAVGAEVEYAHMKDIQKHLNLDPVNLDYSRKYDRAEMDVIATLQMMRIRDEYLEDEEPDGAAYINFLFDIGFTAGRTFSAVQNLTTLEESALVGADAKAKNIERGKKSGSDTRRHERLTSFIEQVETVYKANHAMREYEEMVLKVAFDRAIPKGSYGHGRFNEYCTTLRSDEPYKARFDALFRQSLK